MNTLDYSYNNFYDIRQIVPMSRYMSYAISIVLLKKFIIAI